MFTHMSIHTALPACVCKHARWGMCVFMQECAHVGNVVGIGDGTLDSRNNLLSF